MADSFKAEPESLSSGIAFSPAGTLVEGVSRDGRPVPSTLRKYVLLVVFCLAQFLDVFNNSALFSAIPTIATDLKMTGGESVWIVSATQLTFAAFLLVVSSLLSFALHLI